MRLPNHVSETTEGLKAAVTMKFGSRSDRDGAAVLIRDGCGRVLVIHEAYGFRRFGLPGGRLEPGETPGQAAVRETREETGLDVVLGKLVFTAEFVGADHVPFRAYAFDVVEVRGLPAVQDPNEIESVDWYELDALPEPLTMLAAALLPRIKAEGWPRT